MSGDEGFDAYLDRFHDERPGITEVILARARDEDGEDPYRWLVAGAPPGPVVDLACGSAPT
jgi:hypothetical protein